MSSKKEKIVTVVALIALVLVTVGISYAAFNYIGQGQRENTIQTGNLTFVYDESNKEGNGISIENATPTSDELGSVSRSQGEVFEFSVTASTKGTPIYYEIYVTKQDSSTLPEKVVKTYLTNVQGEEETGVPNTLTNEAINTYNKLGLSQVPDQENGRTLYQEMIPEGQSNYNKTFRYRMWISETATSVDSNGVWKYNNMSFTVRVNVYASNEEIGMPIVAEPEPNPPVLVQGQIPVVYSAEKSAWVKANTIDEWYDYANQEWANVVTVTETNRETYMSASAGTEIAMDDINTMWVWIPRYEYMYTNLGDQYAGGTSSQPGEIKIRFVDGIESTPSNSEKYKVHPAFTFGSDELEGLWYGKFETSTADNACNSCGTNNATCATRCNKLMISLQVKPNVASWRYTNLSNYFSSARNMQLQYASTYGFSETDSDIHMSKNSEWGSVAYLSQSKYGKYGNSNYEGVEKEVRINNCSNFITGVGASSQNEGESTLTCTTNTYETEQGITSSTTGNITGVYDMSGGAFDYVMGNYNNIIGSYSGFTILPDEKYYDLYVDTSIEMACNFGICYGHALSETSGWYFDYDSFLLSSDSPWLIRGGNTLYHMSAGVFSYSPSNGDTGWFYASRLTHVPLK